MPVNVSVIERAIVTAGLANDVEEVNQYAAVIYAATERATAIALCRRETATITPISPNVATNSPSHCPGPVRAFVDTNIAESSNIKFASATPKSAPETWKTMYRKESPQDISVLIAADNETTGLKWAPELDANVSINATRTAPVAIVFASKATATFPP